MDNLKLIFLLVSFLVFVATVIAEEETYYKILGVAEDASVKDIKRQFKKLAIKYHPDKLSKNQKKNKATVAKQQEKFIKIKTAYEELSDPAKRKKYDRQLQMERSGFGGFHSGQQRFGGDSMFGGDFFMHFDPFHGDDFGDSIFGSFRSQFAEPQAQRWSDHDDSDYHGHQGHGHHGHGHGHHMHMHSHGQGHGQNCQVFIQRIGNTVRKTVQCF